MVIGIIGTLVGLMILGAGIYYLIKEKKDSESKKIYSITSGVGVVVSVISIIILITNI